MAVDPGKLYRYKGAQHQENHNNQSDLPDQNVASFMISKPGLRPVSSIAHDY